ncbi:transcription factor A, mitochondrial-like [Haliotis rufescens]|uniref:transcription factor A, mitochondrial-like n=1 Tax=Haliotis rufescens TaxID=6454 RepID=UPI00201F703C|nr:transcription factor A, mitochondrial-like [Haliotis rufescens]
MAVTRASGLLELSLRQHASLCWRCPSQLRHLVVSSRCNTQTPPKRPVGAFLEFAHSQTAEILENNPGVSRRESLKIASQRWHQLDPQEKDERTGEVRERYREYQRQYQLYLQSLTTEERDRMDEQRQLRRKKLAKIRKKRELKSLGKPKSIRNAFLLFVKSSRLETRGANPTTVIQRLVENWKTLPQDEKEIYYEDARLDRERYEMEMKVWEDKMKAIGREDVIRIKSKTKITKAAKPPARKVKKAKKAKKVISNAKSKAGSNAKTKTRGKTAATPRSKSTKTDTKSTQTD